MHKRLSTLCLLALAPAFCVADIIPTSRAPTGTGPFTWVYDFVLASAPEATTGAPAFANRSPMITSGLGAFITIYDFAGYVGGSCLGPGGWTCTAQNIGSTPDRVSPIDQVDAVNLTWTYVTGPAIHGDAGGVDLGAFSAMSLYGFVGELGYAARAVKNNGGKIGSFADNVGSTQGPSASAAPDAVTEVPEPSSLALAGLAVGMLGWSRQRSSAKNAPRA